MRSDAPWLVVLVAASPLLGCGGAAGVDRFELEILGIVSVAEGDRPGMKVGLLWEDGGSGCLDRRARVATPLTAVTNGQGRLEGSVSSVFRLMVTAAPPATARFVTANADPAVARAYLVAFDEANRVAGYATNPGRVVYGVFFAKGEVPGNAEAAGLYGGTPLRAGYQLGLFDRSPASGNPGLRIAGPEASVRIDAPAGAGGPIHADCP